MRRLSQPATLKQAAAAATLSTLASLPRLGIWENPPAALGLLIFMLGICAFVLWAFVFAWFRRPEGSFLSLPRRASDWATAVAVGLGGAILLQLCVDPTLRVLRPQDYPRDFAAWLASALFTLGFVQLFLCFAPLALFLRLLRSPLGAAVGTLLFGVILLAIQLTSTPAPFSTGFTLVLVSIRLLFGSISIALAFRGGPWLLALSMLLVESRLLPQALGWSR